MTSQPLQSNSTNDSAPDRFERVTLGRVDCQTALIANTDASKEQMPQQDRMSVASLPGITPTGFRDLMQKAFQQMQAADERLWTQEGFRGSSCVTMTMLDPKSGKLAIGSKGDVSVFLALEKKDHPNRVIIRRISSPNQEYSRPPVYEPFPNGIHNQSLPPAYAQPESFREPARVLEINKGLFGAAAKLMQPGYKLLDLPDLAQAVLDERGQKSKKPQGKWQDYKLSIITASDGLTYGVGSDNGPALNDMAKSMLGAKDNVRALVNEAMTRPTRSQDNISVAVMNDIQIGQGEPVVACIADGASLKRDKKNPEGNIHAQAMIETFERVVQEQLGKSGAGHAVNLKPKEDKRLGG